MIHHSRRLIQLLSCYLDYRTGGSLLDSRPGSLLKSAEVPGLRSGMSAAEAWKSYWQGSQHIVVVSICFIPGSVSLPINFVLIAFLFVTKSMWSPTSK